MYNERHFAHDSTVVAFDDEAAGITTDGDDDVQFDWDEVETTRIEDPPWQTAFDTKEFYKLPATVARPIDQQYSVGDGETVTLKKPREELQQAAWSLDNAPWTMGHPDTGVVKDVSDVRGFWRSPRYVDGLDDLDADLHVPIGDEDAREFLEQYGDVSVGFYNSVVRTDEYDGTTDSDADTDVDGYQTDIMFDHVASVPIGRCPSEEGCGLAADDGDGARHGHFGDGFKNPTGITNNSSGENVAHTTDAPDGIYTVDGTWFAVGPDDHSKESTDHPDDAMFPVDSCADVEDAWNLRNHAEDLTIEQSTLNARIKRAGDAQDCSDMPWEDSENDSQTDCGCDTETNSNNSEMNLDIDMDDLTREAVLKQVSDKHDGVASYLDEMEQFEDAADAAQDAADALDCEDVTSLTECVESLQSDKQRLAERVDELTEPKVDEAAEFIADASESYEDAEEVKADHDGLEDLQKTKELLDSAVSETDEQTANPDGEGTTDANFGSSYAARPSAWGGD